MNGKSSGSGKEEGKKVIRILLVDDIAEAREGIKKLLAFEPDFQVVGSASNGKEGVAQAKELEPDIVIMDINMPDMDGLEAAGRITKALPTVGVIMMSVQDDPDYMQKAMLAGARFFLSKPPTMDQLYNTIRNVYQQYEPIRRQMAAMNSGAMMMPVIDDDDQSGGGRAGHVIAVYSPKGGAGTTTIATNLASGLMKEGIKTLLIDADLEFGDVGIFLDLRPQSTIADAATNAADIDFDYLDNIVTTHNSGMKVLLGPPKPAAAHEIRDNMPESIELIIQKIAHYYDFVIVDTSTALDRVTGAVLDMATKVLLVVNPTLPSIKSTRLVIDLFDQSGYPAEKTSIIVNKAFDDPRKARGMPTPEKIQTWVKRPVIGVIPLVEETIILNAINKGVPVIASDRDQSKAPIKQLLKMSEHIHATMMGVEDSAQEQENTKEKKSWSLFGNR